MKNITVEIRDEDIGLALMDMPARPFNVFSEEMMDDLAELIEFAGNNLKGLVIGSAKSAFAAGADLEMIKSFADMRFEADAPAMKARFSYLGQLFRRLERLPIPVVAAINGLALGGGLELALACHARVCVNAPHPLLGVPEVQLGLFPGAGGTQRLPRLVRLQQAMRMLLTGNPVTPETALAEGLVDELCAPELLIERALERARSLRPGAVWDRPGFRVGDQKLSLLNQSWIDSALDMAGVSPRDHQLYPAIAAITECVGRGLPLDIDAGCHVEWDAFVELMRNPVAANMVVTCFLNKTATPKYAARQSREIRSCCWLSAQPQPSQLARKLPVVGPTEAEVSVVDAGEPGEPRASDAPDDAVILANANVESDRWTIRYAGDLAKVEAVEVANVDPRAGQGVFLAMAMGKIPILVEGAGITGSVLAKLSAWRLRAGSRASFESAVTAVGLEETVALIDPEFRPDASRPAEPAARNAGLALLAELSLAAFDGLQSGVVSQPELLDVLLVYGLRFPRWTGGPIAFLAMLQREECGPLRLDEPLQRRFEAIQRPLKLKASYAPAPPPLR